MAIPTNLVDVVLLPEGQVPESSQGGQTDLLLCLQESHQNRYTSYIPEESCGQRAFLYYTGLSAIMRDKVIEK